MRYGCRHCDEYHEDYYLSEEDYRQKLINKYHEKLALNAKWKKEREEEEYKAKVLNESMKKRLDWAQSFLDNVEAADKANQEEWGVAI